MATKIYPVPELISDDYIRIDEARENEGCMDNTSRIMRVPLLDTPACRHVRAHEMAHSKYSPKAPIAPEHIPGMVVQRVEDMRMNVYCRKQGLDAALDAPFCEADMWPRLLTSPGATLTAGISTYRTGDWAGWLRHARPSVEDEQFIADLWDRMGDEPTWDDTLSLCQHVVDYLKADDDSGADASGDTSSDQGGAGGSDGDQESDAEGDSAGPSGGKPVDLSGNVMDKLVDAMLDEQARQEGLSPFEKGVEALEEMAQHVPDRREALIIEATVVRRPLTQRLAPSKLKSRSKVPSDRGMVPKYMNRYCTDKAVFAGRGKKRDHGGTILIDASGSMRIHDKDVDNVMKIAPLGTIASYSGEYRTGEIWVIAQNGKRAVGKLRPSYLGNLVDVSALEWAVKQPGPHYWVCDGILTGGDRRGGVEASGSKEIYDRCLELVKKHGVIVVPSLDQLPKVMEETL